MQQTAITQGLRLVRSKNDQIQSCKCENCSQADVVRFLVRKLANRKQWIAAYLEPFRKFLVDFGADGSGAGLSLIAGKPSGDDIVGFNLLERDINILCNLQNWFDLSRICSRVRLIFATSKTTTICL